MNEKNRASRPDSASGASSGAARPAIPPGASPGAGGPTIPPAAQDHTRVGTGRSAPAHDAAAFGLPVHPPCPFCAALHTELHSPFGPQLSVATYWCNDCRTPFELLKWRGHDPAGKEPGESK